MPLGPRPADIPRLRLVTRIYRVSSLITGTLLLGLAVVSCIRWFAGYDIYYGPDGFYLALPQQPGLDVTTVELVVHGWFYVLYVALAFLMWRLARFSFGRFLFICAGGVIPFLSYFLEVLVPRRIERIIGEAARRSSEQGPFLAPAATPAPPSVSDGGPDARASA